MASDAYDVMDLKALRCFWATAKHASLTQAGIELGITEAAVSQRVRSLEKYLGSKLYEATWWPGAIDRRRRAHDGNGHFDLRRPRPF